MQAPLVTVIVPVYNCERYIGKCLKSISEQSYTNLEILVINDGSTDRSGEVIAGMCAKDGRILLLDQENAGVSAARNRGARQAAGSYITFVDGDDFLGRSYIESFVKTAEEEKADLCVSGFVLVDEAGKKLGATAPESPYVRFVHEEYPYRILSTLARFYRTEFWRRHSVEYENDKRIRGEDIPVALLTNALARNIQCVADAEYYYVQHSGSARKGMRGLRRYRLPYEALEKCIAYVMGIQDTNGRDFFELGVFRVFVTFLFDLGRGASKKELQEIYEFETKITELYFPDYKKNKKLRIFSGLAIPLWQRLALSIYMLFIIKPKVQGQERNGKKTK